MCWANLVRVVPVDPEDHAIIYPTAWHGVTAIMYYPEQCLCAFG